MSDQLDLLLDSVREPEPFDETFVASVMAEVTRIDAKRSYRRRGLRRPLVMGIAAGIVVTGGAVAAVVGTNPSNDEARATKAPPAAVTVSATPDDRRASADAPATQAAPADDPAPARTKTPKGAGYASDHSAFIVDEETGLLLQTDTHSAAFTVGKAQRVTLTMENTGDFPIAMSAPDGCPLQVMAYGADEGVGTPDSSLLTDPRGRFEWVCAGSDDDPRDPSEDQAWVLAPGERTTADAFLVLPEGGDWTVNGMCRCDYKQVKPTPVPKSDPLTQLTRRALPSPLLPEQPDGKNLVTPPIAVRAD